MSTLPTQLGPYEIIREIARSNDIVYEAFDPRMNRRVAVKELSVPHGATDPQTRDRIARFEREARAVGMLNHPNIMTVHTTGEDGGRVYMAMEFLDGVSLRKELDTLGTLPLERAVEIALEVLDGLGHAHANGVVHRDIKPDNIQLVSSGQVKITDFGIARLTFQPNLTIDGQVFGTPSYMSPEQVVGKEIDARTDLFAVGVMLYEMLTGVKPFAGDSVVTITYNIVNVSPNPAALIPNPIWHVISTALEKSVSARYSTAQEMREALSRALENAQAPPAPVAPWLVGAPATSPYGGSAPPIVAGPPAMPGGFGVAPVDPYVALATAQRRLPPTLGGMVPPIYYPAPPRPPLLSDEAKRAWGRFFTIFISLALLLWILIQGINALSSASSRSATSVTPVDEQVPTYQSPSDSAPGGSAAATSNPPGTPVDTATSAPAGSDIRTLAAECRAGDATACDALLRRLDSGEGRSLTPEEEMRSRAIALAGTGRSAEAVELWLSEAEARIAAGDGPPRIREALYNADAVAGQDEKLRETIRAFRARYGIEDALNQPTS